MITYTEEQVKELIRENLSLKKENEEMLFHIKQCEQSAEKYKRDVELAERKYTDLCTRCIEVGFSDDRKLRSDSINVSVQIPAFLTQEAVSIGLVEHIKNRVLRDRNELFLSRGEHIHE